MARHFFARSATRGELVSSLMRAIFIAEGAKTIAGETKPRWQIRLEFDEMVKRLSTFATRAAPNTQMLRVNWYDSVRPRRGCGTYREDSGDRINRDGQDAAGW